MEIKKDTAYGVVPVFKKNNEWQVLLIQQISYRGTNDTFWIFPKGHPEPNETEIETALRELQEETGITEISLETNEAFPIAYSFVHEGVRIEKTVTYWLGYCSTQDTTISQPHEIRELRWCSLEEAEALLTHQNSKDVLAKVQAKIQSR
jgi:bis(5'-nucleosidyl)-tetraphosphatase